MSSEGVDVEDGFMFSIDTMQSYLLKMKKREGSEELTLQNANSFYIKVHPHGEIPWMQSDKSSWRKIEAFSEEISTKFVTIKGEKHDYKVLILL